MKELPWPDNGESNMKGHYIMAMEKSAKRLTVNREPDNLNSNYFLWETGLCKDSEIGVLFGLRYSSVSRRGHMVRARLERDRVFKGKYEKLKSMIKGDSI